MKKNNELMIMTINEMVAFTNEYHRKIYDKDYKAGMSDDKVVAAIEQLYWALKFMPDVEKRITGGYHDRSSDEANDLFYIYNFGMLYKLLRQKDCYMFMHELHDFLEFKVLPRAEGKEFLPANMKYALIETVEKGLFKE